ncbi:UNKNOWN [Stylonychia lemnae]|uniref:Uncharacterized protein n=1 Tax=Stylonychia lemnae TaxID=5949 RepID=A0A078AXA1_STYLE|nr:UNKNOWN [Stylonychia lemnae]|eukprot:CDW85398.1 UNKNOWN [Stylonychia lemnae]
MENRPLEYLGESVPKDNPIAPTPPLASTTKPSNSVFIMIQEPTCSQIQSVFNPQLENNQIPEQSQILIQQELEQSFADDDKLQDTESLEFGNETLDDQNKRISCRSKVNFSKLNESEKVMRLQNMANLIKKLKQQVRQLKQKKTKGIYKYQSNKLPTIGDFQRLVLTRKSSSQPLRTPFHVPVSVNQCSSQQQDLSSTNSGYYQNKIQQQVPYQQTYLTCDPPSQFNAITSNTNIPITSLPKYQECDARHKTQFNRSNDDCDRRCQQQQQIQSKDGLRNMDVQNPNLQIQMSSQTILSQQSHSLPIQKALSQNQDQWLPLVQLANGNYFETRDQPFFNNQTGATAALKMTQNTCHNGAIFQNLAPNLRNQYWNYNISNSSNQLVNNPRF